MYQGGRELDAYFRTLDELRDQGVSRAHAPVYTRAMRRAFIDGQIDAGGGRQSPEPRHWLSPWVVDQEDTRRDEVGLGEFAALMHDGSRFVWRAYALGSLVVEQNGLCRDMGGPDKETRPIRLHWLNARWLWRFIQPGEPVAERGLAQPVHVQVGERHGVEAVTDLYVVLFLDETRAPSALRDSWHDLMNTALETPILFAG